MAGDRVYDELVSFLGDPLFQVPVRTFMDENSIIFDPSITPGEDHRQIHAQYKKLVDTLLEGFCADNKISLDKAIKGIKSMNEVPDLKEVFQGIFEQALAAVDFEVFYSIMCKRNILIQEQTLVLLLSMTGRLPASLVQDDQEETTQSHAPPSRKGGHSSEPMVSENKEDEEILRKAMMESQHEEEVRRIRATQEEKELQKTLAMSQIEGQRLDREKKALEQNMQKLSVSEKLPTPSTSTASKLLPTGTVTAAAATASRPAPRQPMVAKHPQSDVSNSSAASDWLKTAQAEAAKSTTHAAVVAEMSKMSQDELKKRQQYLQEQRDKLLAMKKKQRENQLTVAEKTNKRPSSARAARKAMAETSSGAAAPVPSQTEEDEKKMAMRRAIADKLKLEVIGKP